MGSIRLRSAAATLETRRGRLGWRLATMAAGALHDFLRRCWAERLDHADRRLMNDWMLQDIGLGRDVAATAEFHRLAVYIGRHDLS